MKIFFISLLKIYKYFISPLLPAACRYYPTCSEYAKEAIENYGSIKGIFLSLKRITGCHPFAKGGFDPIPKYKGKKMIDNLSQNSRLLIASILAAVIIFSWQYFFAPSPESYIQSKEHAPLQNTQIIEEIHDRGDLISSGFNDKSRIKIENAKLKGSINLVGARIDDLILKNYKTTIDPQSSNVALFSPSKTEHDYFAEFGWSGNNIDLPNSKTVWQADKDILTQDGILTLSWINNKEIKFLIKIKLDENYLFTVTQEVHNPTNEPIQLNNYTLINRIYTPHESQVNIIHEGPIGVFNERLDEIDYEDIASKKSSSINEKIDWLGFTDKYWLAAIIPAKSSNYIANFSHAFKNNHNRYQGSAISEIYTIKPNESVKNTNALFAGAKEVDLLDKYEKDFNIKLFDRAVDFGILYFITKPIFNLLHYFYNLIGNFGIAILLLTIVIKLLLFPLAYKGFRGMNHLKDLQPKMAKLKEQYKDDAPAFQKALLDMYRKEKVNPMAGCLPIILQIPVFFALYKVLYVTIEMRHAPFFGWIKDLSAPDPTSIFNLFGLLPYDVPQFLMIGVFPILMAFTMFIQQKLNPEPTDPVQAKVMKFLPLIFLFMFASFPSGLVIYWSWSNILSILQQILIKKLESDKPLKEPHLQKKKK